MSDGGFSRDDLVRDLVVTVFRLNGRLVETGNRLVSGIGLTTAWWQALGALFLSSAPLPVAHIARNMGLSRQSVQRVVNLLVQKGLVRFEPNPHHRRAKLVVLTPEGRAAVSAADDRQRPLASDLTAALGAKRLAAALEVLTVMDLQLARAADATDVEIDQKEAQP